MNKCPFNNSFRVSLFHVTRRELMQAESCQSPETAANVEGKMHSCVIVGSARVPFLLPAFPEDSTPQWPHVATTCPGLRCRSWAGGRRENRLDPSRPPVEAGCQRSSELLLLCHRVSSPKQRRDNSLLGDFYQSSVHRWVGGTRILPRGVHSLGQFLLRWLEEGD